eukprot:gene9545-6701_t
MGQRKREREREDMVRYKSLSQPSPHTRYAVKPIPSHPVHGGRSSLSFPLFFLFSFISYGVGGQLLGRKLPQKSLSEQQTIRRGNTQTVDDTIIYNDNNNNNQT